MRGAQALIILFLCGAIALGLGVSTASADYNWPAVKDPDARPPQVPQPVQSTPKDPCDTEVPGSIISCQSQTLGEAVPITGTPFQLHYGSDRTPGRKDAYTLDIPLSGPTLPASLRRIKLEISVAGKKFTQIFAATPNQHYSFSWDGKDAYGRTVQGGAIATVRIGYVYGAVYAQAPTTAASFGYPSGLALSVNVNVARLELEITLWLEAQSRLGTLRAQVGGWSLSPHHVYDPTAQVLYQGDDTRRDAEALPSIITTVAGNGERDFSGDGGPATAAKLSDPFSVAVGPDGSVYVTDTGNSRIRRVGPDGIITTVAGNGRSGFSGDGGPAVAAQLAGPNGVAVGPDGSLYFSDMFNHRIRRVMPDGIITTVAGNGTVGFSGDGGLATADWRRLQH